jgi:membrane protease YdiL (CAAX protease family)
MGSLTWVDHLLALALAVLFPIRASTFGYRRLVQAPAAAVPQVRRSLYVQALWLQWGLAALVAGLWVWRGRPWPSLFLAPGLTPWFIGFFVVAVVVAVFFVLQALRVTGDERALARVRVRLQHLVRMLPHTAAELRVFVALSITAGVCEELLYRGFLMAYFAHWLGPVESLALSSLLFGLGHAYQGLRGVAVTTLVGAALGGVVLGAGALYPAMLLHAAGDIHSGILAQAAMGRRAPDLPGDETAAIP